jgi:type IV secretory pathway TraG/TraD family ATPase VirD4
MSTGIRYFVDYADVREDDEKEITVIRTIAFESVIDAAKWARVLPQRCHVLKKFKVETEVFNVFDESEFDVEISRQP